MKAVIDLIDDEEIKKIDIELLEKSGIDFKIGKNNEIIIDKLDNINIKLKGIEFEKGMKFYYLLLEDIENIEIENS